MRKATRAAVLVVDDDASVRSWLDRSFRRAGYDVHLADSSDAAFQVIDVSCPDIVLLDVMMRGGANGYEVRRAFRDREDMELAPMIFVTALDTEQDEAKAFREQNSVVSILRPDAVGVVLSNPFNWELLESLNRTMWRGEEPDVSITSPDVIGQLFEEAEEDLLRVPSFEELRAGRLCARDSPGPFAPGRGPLESSRSPRSPTSPPPERPPS